MAHTLPTQPPGTADGAERSTSVTVVTVEDSVQDDRVRWHTDPAHTGPVGAATTPELVGRLINDLSDLVDKQIALAKQEIREEIRQAFKGAKAIAIGAGIAAAMGMLLVIWAWSAFIWFFNWIGALLFGDWGSWIGWLLGVLVPVAVVAFAWKRFIQPGWNEAKQTLKSPLDRTRTSLKEDMEWVQRLRTPNGR